MPAIRRRWTAADVRELTVEDRPWPRYELIDRELLVTPAPRWSHQIAAQELWVILESHVDDTAAGRAVLSPADLELKPDTITQPDVFVVPADTEIAGERLEWTDIKSLMLAVEILSPSSTRTDRTTKRDFYLANGIEEYWIVDLDARVFERWLPSSETPELLRDRIVWRPRIGEPFTIELAAWFAKVDRKIAMLPLRFR